MKQGTVLQICEWAMVTICVTSGLFIMFQTFINLAYILFAIGHLGWLIIAAKYLKVKPLAFQMSIFLIVDMIGLIKNSNIIN